MCGRFAQLHPDIIAMHFRARADDWVRDAKPASNVAPSQRAVAVLKERASRTAQGLTWGFRDPRSASRLLINVRSETAASSPLFGPAWRRRRCAVPVEHFYEWGGPIRRPHAVRAPDGDWLVLAAIYEPDGRFSVVTGPALGELATLHDRAPIFLNPEHLDAWLDPTLDAGEVLRGQGQPPPDYLNVIPLSRHLNRRGAEGPECMEPPTDPPSAGESPETDEVALGATLPFKFG
jgi:putative SOS response-associated peptidase YedK